ncbi:hypothetical protein E8E15_001956 [Penicillium rubens]|nr:hypothetical protein E8E15_001956 [Penicillium rubens]
MVHIIKTLAVGLLACVAHAFNYDQLYRGQYHFSPQDNWMNDPSGLLYHNEIYHLFFQYNPSGIQWGNLSWGHATSKDLTHWEEQPVALLARGHSGNVTEMYFTGSAIYPVAQTLPSGKTIQENQQAQSIAYSLDDGSVHLGTTSETIKIDLSFSAASTASKFAIAVRGSADFTKQTLVGYDFVNKQVFIDRTKSGDVSFDNTFASVYRGPLAADVNGKVNLSIFVDRSSVEVFGGQGETTLTAQIFPSRDAINTQLVSTGGTTKSVKIDIFNVASTWN